MITVEKFNYFVLHFFKGIDWQMISRKENWLQYDQLPIIDPPSIPNHKKYSFSLLYTGQRFLKQSHNSVFDESICTNTFNEYKVTSSTISFIW